VAAAEPQAEQSALLNHTSQVYTGMPVEHRYVWFAGKRKTKKQKNKDADEQILP
jgi:hypothetical protein